MRRHGLAARYLLARHRLPLEHGDYFAQQPSEQCGVTIFAATDSLTVADHHYRYCSPRVGIEDQRFPCETLNG